MPSVGEQLRRERESHDATLEQVSRTTKIDLSYLEALERNDFAALPGRAFGKFYIRAYAEVLGFDPERLIAEYESERVSEEPRQEPAVGRQEPRNAWQEALRKNRGEARKVRQASQAAAGPPGVVDLADQANEPESANGVGDPDLAGPEDVRESTPAAEPPVPSAPARPTWTGFPLALAAAGLLVMVALVYWALPGAGSTERAGASTPSIPTASLSDGGESHEDREDVVGTVDTVAASNPTPPPPEPSTKPSPDPPAPKSPPSRLTVPEFGVGRAVVERGLEGSSDRFAEGSVAWFQTRVLGGKRGESIRHVWLREGKPVQSTELKLGGPRWRTHSRKTLWGTGSWAVELRDSAGRVLARATFDCVPADS